MSLGTALHIPSPAKALPMLMALVVVALCGLSFTGYEIGRPWLLFPTLLALALAQLPLLRPQPLDSVTLTGVFVFALVAAITGNTMINRPEHCDIVFVKSMIMLLLPWAVYSAAALLPGVLSNLRPITAALLVLEIALTGQVWFSYYTGWGEVLDLGDGIRRAYGTAGDGFTVLLVFFLLLNALRHNILRCALIFTALMMSGAKMGLLLATICLPLTLLVSPATLAHLRRYAVIVVCALCLGLTLTSTSFYHWINGTPAPPKVIVVPAPPDPTTGYRVKVYEQHSLPEHLAGSLMSTGMGRVAGIGAAWQMLTEHPVTGVGYGQANQPEVFQPAVKADAFHLVSRWGVPEYRLTGEKLIGNQIAIIAAEEGLIGLVPFILMCASALWLCLRTWLTLRKTNSASTEQTALIGACCVWSIGMLVFNQTASWFLSGSVMTVWVAFALGICAAWLRQQASHA